MNSWMSQARSKSVKSFMNRSIGCPNLFNLCNRWSIVLETSLNYGDSCLSRIRELENFVYKINSQILSNIALEEILKFSNS